MAPSSSSKPDRETPRTRGQLREIIEFLTRDEIRHRAIDLRPLRLHQIENAFSTIRRCPHVRDPRTVAGMRNRDKRRAKMTGRPAALLPSRRGPARGEPSFGADADDF
jgi:hypothetical protein